MVQTKAWMVRMALKTLHDLPFRSTIASRSRRKCSKAMSKVLATTARAQSKDYDVLCERLKEISTLNGVSGLLMWDEMVMMPPGAADVRAAQKSILTGIVYDKQTSAEIGHLLKKVEQDKEGLNQYQAAVLREAAREYKKNTAVPKQIEKRRSELESAGYQAWVTARQEKSFSKFAPILQEWIEVIQQRSKYIDSGRPCYDVAMQDYEKGMTSARLDEIFSEVKAGLVPFITKLREQGTAPDASLLAGGPFETMAQVQKLVDLGHMMLRACKQEVSLACYLLKRSSEIAGFTGLRGIATHTETIETAIKLARKPPAPPWSEKSPDPALTPQNYIIKSEMCNRIAKELGFNLDNGRLDVSIHPFTGGAHPKDVRMTTRFKTHDLTEGLKGAIHETGHALYEQARNMEYDGLPVNEALSMGVHESQSLLWERMVALSRPFASYLTPLLTSAFPQLSRDLTPDQVYSAINIMKVPSLIRVEANEVQYPLHILLRYEVEKSLLDGSLTVEEVPRVWNEKMEEYLGAKPQDDSEGCLQDLHWSAGAIGYFPTYLLGAMYACQLYEKAREDLPGLESNIAEGKFSELRQWLADKVHSKGSLYASGDELMIAVTGEPLKPATFLNYLTDKYSKLYKL